MVYLWKTAQKREGLEKWTSVIRKSIKKIFLAKLKRRMHRLHQPTLSQTFEIVQTDRREKGFSLQVPSCRLFEHNIISNSSIRLHSPYKYINSSSSSAAL